MSLNPEDLLIRVVEMAESKPYQFELTAMASYSDNESDSDERNKRTGEFHGVFGKYGLV